MRNAQQWSRILVVVGLVAMVLGALDPLEGSVIILAGAGLVALAAIVGKWPARGLPYWSAALVLLGVGMLFLLSGIGGIGGTSGRSVWWALVLLPYPAGWILGIV